MAKKAAAKKKLHLLTRILIIVIVGAILGVSLFFETQINKALGLSTIKTSDYDGAVAGDVLAAADAGDLNVHFLDVGQGDACIVELPDDKTILIDGGDTHGSTATTIINYINENIFTDDGNVIEYFDYAILTHTDSDHCGSMDDVLKEFPAKVFYRPNVLCDAKGYIDPGKDDLYGNYTSKSTVAYKNVLQAAYAYADVEVFVNSYDLDAIVPDGLSKGDPGYYSLNFYGPNSASYTDWNNYSPIMILEYGDERIALTGDCEKEGEREFVAKAKAGEGKFSVFNDEYYVSVIKLGHHGSRTSTGVDFVDAITTAASQENTLLIISCGFENSYGHPHQEKLDQLLKTQNFKEENVLRTDKNGTIVLSVRYDEESGGLRLFYGASPMVRTPKKIIDWRYIAYTVFGIVVIVVLVIPVLLHLGIITKKDVKNYAKNTKSSKK